MYRHLRPDDVFKCERCAAVYRATARDSIDSADEARCTCCGIILADWPADCGLELIREGQSDKTW